MKNTFIYLLTFLFVSTLYAQPSYKRIKIILLGTFHFNQSLDSNSKLHSALFSAKRQKEVDVLVQQLAAYRPGKIFIERTPREQPLWDSLYQNFEKGIYPTNLKTKANEIVQIGFKTAFFLKLARVTCVDFQPEDFKDSGFNTQFATEKIIKQLWDAIEADTGSQRINPAFLDKKFPYQLPKQDSLLQKNNLSQFLLQMNSPEHYSYYTYVDWTWFYSLGQKYNYIGVDWLSNFWYGRNLRIYRNVLQEVDYENDKTYLLIYGASHMPFLKHLFESNPFFEVVSLSDVLK